jgi:signal transduction histidine kinase
MYPNVEIIADFDHQMKDALIRAEPIINELFINILDNAVRVQINQEEKPYVKVSISKDSDRWVTIDICDKGPGIADDRKSDLFSRFERTAERAHTGIGLSIVKVLVDRYNGRIDVLDRIKGDHSKGALFRIQLPLDHNQ